MIKLPEIPASIGPEMYRYYVILYQNIFQLEERIIKLEEQAQRASSTEGVV